MQHKHRLFPRYWLLSWLFMTPLSVNAMEIAQSNLLFSNLNIAPAAGTLQFFGDWQLSSFAEARNSLGEWDQQYNDNYDPNSGTYTGPGPASSDARVRWAGGHGNAQASIPADTNVTSSASSNVSLPGIEDNCIEKWASSLGFGGLSNGFTISGGNAGDTVNVNFSGLFTGSLSVSTDTCKSHAETDVIYKIELFDDSIPGSNDMLGIFRTYRLSIGSHSLDRRDVNDPFSNTLNLIYGDNYSILISVDSESYAWVPEPPSIALILLGTGAWAGLAAYRRRVSRSL